MDRATVLALDRINRDFYSTHAAEFTAAREAPWPGWDRLLPHLRRLPEGGRGEVLHILDVGCGSGRLARWLAQRLERPHRVVGLDRSLPILLVRARGDAATSVVHDLVSSAGEVPFRGGCFDAVAAIGLLHHLPSFELRRALVSDLLRVARPGGILALAFWQFGADPRFEGRRVPWERLPAVDRAQLEPGDRLLRWGSAGETTRLEPPLRYCHYTEPAEAHRLLEALDGEVVDSYHADGRSGALNLYLVSRRR
jgi:SAM-dependent methyltransferase